MAGRGSPRQGLQRPSWPAASAWLRDPRNGRNFEYLGEDPWLAGNLAGASIKGIQDQGVVSTIVKHFSLNGQETHRPARQFGDRRGGPPRERPLGLSDRHREGPARAVAKWVMCAYNLVSGAYSCGNDHLLNTVLKRDWGYKGWVMSDWGAVHATDYMIKGLDQQSGEQLQLDAQVWLRRAARGRVASRRARSRRAPGRRQPPHPALDVRRGPVRQAGRAGRSHRLRRRG
ncbi:glycoside hydrolase family 3 N-terminal domain-containing protein [Caulobacter segnis]